MGQNYPNSPIQGQVFTSTTGLQYVYLDGVWRIVEAPQDIGKAQARNRLVNGAMQISQEAGDASAAIVASNTGYYAADQWVLRWGVSPGTMSAARYPGPMGPDAGKSVYLSVVTAKGALAAGDYAIITTFIEGIRVADLQWGTSAAKAVILRFFVRPTVDGLYSVRIANSAENRSYVAQFNATTAGTIVTIPIPGDTTGTWLKDTGVGLKLEFVAGAGSNIVGAVGWQAGAFYAGPGQTNGVGTVGGFHITNVGLYLDPLNTGIAPPWQMPDEAEELQACQRYWFRSAFNFSQSASGVGHNVTYRQNFQVTMRTSPAMTQTGPVSNASATGNFLTDVYHNDVYATAIGGGNINWGPSTYTASARM